MAETEILFSITKDNLESGLRGYPIGYCTTSLVDPIKGLLYSEIPIEKFAFKEPEEVIYLLYSGRKELDADYFSFKDTLVNKARCPQKLVEAIYNLPREGHPMKIFTAALLLAGMFLQPKDYQNDCIEIIAKIPEIAAHVINHHAGWVQKNDIPESQPQNGYIENFTQLLKIPNKNEKDLLEIMKIFNILHLDHGGGNLSTFVGKAIASGLEDMYGSLAGAMVALEGPRHGRANQECLEFVEELRKSLGSNPTDENVENFIRLRLEKKELIYGFGHAVLRVEDPRATILYELASKKYGDHPLVKLALLLREQGSKVLKENPKITDPYPNVDAISGVMLTVAGFPFREYFTLLFGMARCVGIAIQIVYERCEARGGKGTPIVRPKYLYRSRFEK